MPRSRFRLSVALVMPRSPTPAVNPEVASLHEPANLDLPTSSLAENRANWTGATRPHHRQAARAPAGRTSARPSLVTVTRRRISSSPLPVPNV